LRRRPQQRRSLRAYHPNRRLPPKPSRRHLHDRGNYFFHGRNAPYMHAFLPRS
jgi:hypothetical protein